ncbi:hypothetical protein OH818_20815 [Jiella pelagia]|uniref:Uncharacterized protein n=1 Tax=Jiella pelagia TaxID=2986949 RepID=A0ABY7C801_9HYPH|nr:hypothetical protein [Jiella pelagia]WAP71376.1 hypothetical protein OH818_20815 [Jiella pelagia]
MSRQNVERAAENGDVREILLGIVREAGEESRVDGEGEGGNAERKAVRISLGDEVGAHHRAAARPIVNDHRLVETLAEILGQQPRHLIIEAAGWIGDHDRDRPVGVGRGRVLCMADGKGKQCRHHQAGCDCLGSHSGSSTFLGRHPAVNRRCALCQSCNITLQLYWQ